MGKIKSLDEIANSKRIILILIIAGAFLYILINSIVETYNDMKKEFEQKRTLNLGTNIDIKDRSSFDLDQLTAIKNKMEEVKQDLENKLNEAKNSNEKLNQEIEQNQKILEEQQSELIALRSLSDKEEKIANKKVSDELKNFKEILEEQKKEIERLKKERVVSEKLNNNIQLPELKGPLENIIIAEASSSSQSDIPSLINKEEIVVTPSNKDFFKFNERETNELKENINDDIQATDIKEEAKTMDLMMGLVDAIMVTGVDAPTNIGTKNSDAKDPLPVLLSVNSEAIIANNHFQEYKDCLILGTATGNATTERAYIRLSKMSCVSKNGQSRIETAIEGWVYGEDNKVGVSGHLVTKSGTLILKGLMAGVLQGIADSVSNTDNYFDTGNGFRRQNNGLGQGAAEGFGSGVGSAFKTLADFYIEMAKDLYPVVEVKGGRTVQLLVKGGNVITEVPYNKLFVNTDYQIDMDNNIKIEY